MQSPALFKNIFKFQMFCPFFEKSHACPLSRIGPEYTN